MNAYEHITMTSNQNPDLLSFRTRLKNRIKYAACICCCCGCILLASAPMEYVNWYQEVCDNGFWKGLFVKVPGNRLGDPIFGDS